MRIKARIFAVAASAAVVAGLGGGIAASASSVGAAQPSGDVHACVDSNGAIKYVQFRSANFGKCSDGYAAWSWARTDGSAPAAPTAPVTASLTAGTINAGGSFGAGHTNVGSLALTEGTWQVNVYAKAEPCQSATGAISPQLYVYNGTPLSDFSNDLFNASSDLQPFVPNASSQHDTYINGSYQVKVPAGGETLQVEGFGYVGDQSASTWQLMSGNVQASKIG